MGTCLVVEINRLATENLKVENSISKPWVTKTTTTNHLGMNKKAEKGGY